MPATLLQWAAGFAAHAPPLVAAKFQAFLSAQNAELNPTTMPEIFSVGDDDDMHQNSEEAEDDPYYADEAGGDALAQVAAQALAGPAASASTAVRLQGSALPGFGRVKTNRSRESPYDGAAAVDIAAAAGTAALAAEALASLGDGLVETKTEVL